MAKTLNLEVVSFRDNINNQPFAIGGVLIGAFQHILPPGTLDLSSEHILAMVKYDLEFQEQFTNYMREKFPEVVNPHYPLLDYLDEQFTIGAIMLGTAYIKV
jgi:hypothetical protein